MSNGNDHRSLEPAETHLSPWEGWTEAPNAQPITDWDDTEHNGWCEKWAPPCPDGSPQRLQRALGFRERNVRELELRVLLGGDDGGVCQVIVDERDDEIYVRVLVCLKEAERDENKRSLRWREYADWPVRVWLERPLGQRAVIDVDSDEELPLYVPLYQDNILQTDSGYHQVSRRQQR